MVTEKIIQFKCDTTLSFLTFNMDRAPRLQYRAELPLILARSDDLLYNSLLEKGSSMVRSFHGN